MKIKFEVDTLNNIEVEFEAYPKVEDIGIGSYECHGYRGRDVNYQVTCEDIQWDLDPYSFSENATISEWLDKNDAKVSAQFCKEYEETEPSRLPYGGDKDWRGDRDDYER